jgi:hypothetical protein
VAAYDPELWHDFYVAAAGASAALLGLAFVAISINLAPIIESAVLPRRALQTLIFFAYGLVSSLLVLVPGLSDTALGVGQLVLGLGLVGLVAIDQLDWRGQPGDPSIWRLSQVIPATLVSALALIGAYATISSTLGGLYWIAIAIATATTAGLINSWVLLVEIQR